MSDEILKKFERLRELRRLGLGADGTTPVAEEWAKEIDTIAAELEQWARQAPAGEVLDRVCAEFMGEDARRRAQCWSCGHKVYDGDIAKLGFQECERCGEDGARGYLLYRQGNWRKFSTDPAAAMELLQAVSDAGDGGRLECDMHGVWSFMPFIDGFLHEDGYHVEYAEGDTAETAICRTVAMMEARGIKRGDQ